jgi:hypothetical protein
MKPYTVILIYPDYIASQYGEEFWYDHVEAETVAQAIEAARQNAQNCNETYDDCGKDFAVVAVFEGHHYDKAWEAA